MKNPNPWPSFDNLSVSYAESAADLVLVDFATVVIFLQRKWRQRELPRKHQKIYPITVSERARNVLQCARKILRERSNPKNNITVFAYEKLDGTNVGVCCDGSLYGRRTKIQGTSYQKVFLNTVPEPRIVKAIKKNIADLIAIAHSDLPKFTIYGELMCQPGRYSYTERNLAKNWVCFGAVFGSRQVDEDQIGNHESPCELAQALEEKGFLATVDRHNGKVRISLNDTFALLVQNYGLKVPPFVGKGPLKEICLQNMANMMTFEREGLVLTGNNFIRKWKTGKEDESKGHALLKEILNDHSKMVLEMAGVDFKLATCLAQVAGNKPASTVTKKSKKEKACTIRPYTNDELERALDSARSKYDALEAYFEREEMNLIKSYLLQELCQDLGASTTEQTKCIDQAVGKTVGQAFGAWKKINAKK